MTVRLIAPPNGGKANQGEPKVEEGTSPAGADPTRIGRWIVIYLAVLAGRRSDSIDIDRPLADFDLDSVNAVELALEFERAFGLELDPEFFLYGNQSLREMVAKLAERTQLR